MPGSLVRAACVLVFADLHSTRAPVPRIFFCRRGPRVPVPARAACVLGQENSGLAAPGGPGGVVATARSIRFRHEEAPPMLADIPRLATRGQRRRRKIQNLRTLWCLPRLRPTPRHPPPLVNDSPRCARHRGSSIGVADQVKKNSGHRRRMRAMRAPSSSAPRGAVRFVTTTLAVSRFSIAAASF